MSATTSNPAESPDHLDIPPTPTLSQEKWPALRTRQRKAEKRYRGTHRVERRKINKAYVRSLKKKVIYHYSEGSMACIGLEESGCCFHVNPTFFPLEVLLAIETIDHPNNDGGKHRKELFGKRGYAGYHFYQWLIKNNFPPDYQVLCFNCQWIKRFNDLNTMVEPNVN